MAQTRRRKLKRAMQKKFKVSFSQQVKDKLKLKRELEDESSRTVHSN